MVRHQLIAPGLLSLPSVHQPDGLAKCLQPFEHGQRLLPGSPTMAPAMNLVRMVVKEELIRIRLRGVG